MSKATRIRQQNARQKIAAQRAAEKRAETRRRMFITGGSVLAVIVIVVAFIVVKTVGGSSSSTPPATSSPTGTPLPASVASDIAGVPASAFATVGKGSVPSYNPSPVNAVTGAPLTSQGKPEMLYIGAEFCPYCAAMRWSMATALSRFGTLSTPLHGIHSSSTDVFPSTATLTFYKSSYNSKYLTFTPVENETVNRTPLQATTAAQQALWEKYNPNSYPFIDFGNKFVIKSPIYDPGVLKGKTWSQIAAALHDPSSPVAQGVLGAANYITAAICKTTNNQPASVCNTPTIKTVAGGL
jgi:thiol-disulfide isomerase/thioredoxin